MSVGGAAPRGGSTAAVEVCHRSVADPGRLRRRVRTGQPQGATPPDDQLRGTSSDSGDPAQPGVGGGGGGAPGRSAPLQDRAVSVLRRDRPLSLR